MEYIAVLFVFIAGMSCVWAHFLNQQVAFLQTERLTLLQELEKARFLLHSEEKEHISLIKEYEATKHSFESIQKYINETKDQLVDRMKLLSHDVLTSTQSHFFTSAKSHFDESQKRFHAECSTRDEKVSQLINPLKSSLEEMNKKVGDLEMLRKESQGAFFEQISVLTKETSFLVKALRHPVERGKWGEAQLKRFVEMAGLLERCDFSTQETSFDGSLRADMVVTLPNSRKIIIDAKVPLEAYLKAIEAESPEICEKEMDRHVEQLEKHIKILSDKKYWGKYQGAIDFTVLFLPSEAILAAALRKKSHLIELAIEKHILLASPSTLMALLYAVKCGWKETLIHKDIQGIIALAKEWSSRSEVFVEHIQKLGKSLSQSVGSYNTAIQSFESRFLVTMRKLAKESEIASNSAIDGLEPLSAPCAELLVSQEGL
ncbi:MAG: DNA recombination protein RmuC [Chlamydia sp.]